MTDGFEIAEEIGRAYTLPARVYRDPDVYRRMLDRVFVPSWQLVGDTDLVRAPGRVWPLTLLEGSLDEPLVVTRDAHDRLHCLGNVCTHRGALVCESAGTVKGLRCRYHGRRFDLAGRCTFMPEFEGVEGFPGEPDHLPRVPLAAWGKLLFASLAPPVLLDEVLRPVEERVGFLPIAEAVLDRGRSRDYLVQANWALYVDNYLEGFHIPYVHPSLAGAIDYDRYRTELFDHASVQVAVAEGGDDVFDLPAGSPDHGQAVAAYYFWLFPNTMLNVYPWGISVNVVKPLGPERTRVSFLSYVWDPERLDRGAGAALDRVEREDEAVVEAVQRGVRSRLYHRGRYSPAREQGVHHFHRLLVRALSNGR